MCGVLFDLDLLMADYVDHFSVLVCDESYAQNAHDCLAVHFLFVSDTELAD